MSRQYDVIVIGAGFSGLSVAALMAKAGKKVGVLEAMSQVAGRATTYKHVFRGREYNLDVGGTHIIDMPFQGSLASVYREIEKYDDFAAKIISWQGVILIWRGGKWVHFRDLIKGTNRDDYKTIIDEIDRTSYENLDQYDSMTLGQWLRERTARQDVIDCFNAIAFAQTTISDPERVSAGESLWIIKAHRDCRPGTDAGGYGEGGSMTLALPLVDYVQEHGGDVRTDARVTEILVRNRTAQGVVVGELPPTASSWDVPETIESPAIVYSAPIWDIFQILPEFRLPPPFVRLVDSYRNPNMMTSAAFPYIEKKAVLDAKVLDQMAYGGSEITLAFRSPHTGLPHMTGQGIGDLESQRAAGELLFTFHTWDVSPALIDSREKEDELIENFEKDFAVFYPNMTNHIIESKTILRRRPGVVDGLARSPYYTGNFRIDHKSPIQGLYFCGDTVRSRGIGIDAAVRSGIWCFNRIMGENIPTFTPA